jgi:hypothetical protein
MAISISKLVTFDKIQVNTHKKNAEKSFQEQTL